MNAKYKQTVAYLAVVAILFLGSAAYAQPFGDAQEGAAGYKQGRMKNHIKDLELTPEQQEQLKAQRIEQMKKGKELRNKLRAKRKALREELEKEDVDKSKIYGLVAEIKTILGNQVEQRVEGILSTKEILTPEQFEKLQQKRTEAKANRKSQRNTPHPARRKAW